MNNQNDERLHRLKGELGHLLLVSEDTRTVVAEGTGIAILEVLSDAIRDFEYRRGVKHALEIVRSHISPGEIDETGRYCTEGAPGAELLQQVIPALEVEGHRIFPERLPAYDWIWMIRRLPLRHLWKDNASATFRLTLTNLALDGNRKDGVLLPNGWIKLTPRHGRSLAFLMGFATVLSLLIMAYRWIGKAGGVEINFQLRQIGPIGPEELIESFDQYDARVFDEKAWGGLGIFLQELSAAPAHAEHDGNGTLALAFGLSTPQWDNPENPKFLRRYSEQYVNLDEAFSLIGQNSLDPELLNADLDLLLPLMAGFRLLLDESPVIRTSVRQVGYTVHIGDHAALTGSPLGRCLELGLGWARANLHERIPATADDLWTRLLSLGSSMSPLQPGPVVLPVNDDAVLIDWYAASTRLISALRYPKDHGDIANRRAIAFELTVRDAIRRTPCAPAQWLEELFGKHLRQNGRTFGEIDAGASLPEGNVHLVVSCKSYQFTEAYERGDYNAVRNVAGRLEQDVRDVIEFTTNLNNTRVGDNYTIPADATLIPVVVTPRVMYIPGKVSHFRILDREAGPRIVSSVTELISLLNGFVPVDE